MAQIKLLKVVSGYPQEMDSAADDVTLNSFTAGAGPVMSPTGIDMNSTDISDIEDIVVENPAASTINQTAGNLIIDNIMAKERSNVMTTAGDILFPVIADSAGEVDAFRLPALAGTPTATPTASGEGFVVWDSTNNKMYVWDGAAWDDQSTVTSAENLDRSWTAQVNVAIRDAVYISSADNVSPADASAISTAGVVGFALAAATAGNPVSIRHEGVVTGFAGLTAGARYFLSETTGAITSTPPTGSGTVVFFVGFAKSTTALLIEKQFIAVRS